VRTTGYTLNNKNKILNKTKFDISQKMFDDDKKKALTKIKFDRGQKTLNGKRGFDPLRSFKCCGAKTFWKNPSFETNLF
jgi:hypothetical protein